jgi:adenosylcobinamide hydrolase
MDLDFPDVSLTVNSDVLLLRSQAPLHMLASTIIGGGFSQAVCILSRHVNKNYDHADPESDLRTFARKYGIEEPFIGFMTAVYLDQGVRTVTLRDRDLTVTVVTTMGLSNATAAGLSPPAPYRPGTINIIMLVDANLTPAAMVNTVITATEAKTDVLLAQDISTPAGQPATGTSTDAVVVACTGRGTSLAFAGPATRVGWLIGRGVRQALES